MKAPTFTSILLLFAIYTSINIPINAQEIEIYDLNNTSIEDVTMSINTSIEDVTMSIVENAQEYNHITQGDTRHTIYNYMLANGDLTQEQINTLVTERELIKAELNALRDSGNNEALTARITELREERENNKEELRTYVDTHEDLAATISNYREEITERRNEQDRHNRNHRDDTRR